MSQFDMTIRLVDVTGKSKEYKLATRPQGLVSKPVFTDRGFGSAHTDYAELDGYQISGDLWRFIEGTLGMDALVAQIVAEARDSQSVLEDFVEVFKSCSNDELAVQAWTDFVSERSLEGSDKADYVAEKLEG